MANYQGGFTTKGNHHDSDFAAKIRETKEAFTEAAHKAREAATSMSEKVTHDVKERSVELQQNMINYVRREPLKAVGIAMGVGVVLSWLLRR